eukprot:248262_1
MHAIRQRRTRRLTLYYWFSNSLQMARYSISYTTLPLWNRIIPSTQPIQTRTIHHDKCLPKVPTSITFPTSNDCTYLRAYPNHKRWIETDKWNHAAKQYKDPSFASEQYAMDNLPSELTMDYLLDKSQFYKEHCDAVERTFKKILMG